VIAATFVLLVGLLLIPRLQRRSAAERHLLWTLVLGSSALLPLLALIAPLWSPAWASDLARTLATPLDFFKAAPPQGQSEIVIRALGIDTGGSQGWRLVAWLWAAGSALVFLRMGSEAIRLRRLTASARPVVDGPPEGGPHEERWLALVREMTSRLGLQQQPRLLFGAHLAIPITWGVRHPRILLPAAAADWSDERCRIVLMHELGHIRRADWLVHVAAESICAAYWFHPLVWMAARRLSQESELAADDCVLAHVDASTYAAHLVDIVRLARHSPRTPAPTVAMARVSRFEQRVAALLRDEANRQSRSRRTLSLTLATAVVSAISIATLAARTGGTNVNVLPTTLPPLAGTATAGQLMVPSVRIAGNASVEPPEVIEYLTPALYSEDARRRGVEGVVTIGTRISRDGRVSDLRVLKGLGFGLDQNALVAVRHWTFSPARRAGTPVETSAEIDVEFNLRNEALNELIANDMATRVGPGVTPPRAIRTAEIAGGAGARGRVVLDVVLLENGAPKIVRILESSGAGMDDRAIRVFEQWRFSPAMKNGKPVRVRMTAEVTFRG
jgi:TonB family protein